MISLLKPFVAPVWVDDLAVPIVSSAESLISSAALTMSVIWNLFRAYRLECNMAAGKTAVLPYFGGAGANMARREASNLADCMLPVPLALSDKPIGMRIVSMYTHMGHRTSATGSAMPEIMWRHDTAKPVIRRVSYQLFVKSKVAVKKKLMVASSLMLSRELYGVGCLPCLSVGEREKLHGHVMSVYRRATSEAFTGDKHVLMVPDSELLHVHELRAPHTFVRFARLRMSIRIILRAPFEVIALIYAARKDPKSWFAAFTSDLKWMALCDPDASFTLLQWCRYVRANPKRARTLVRNICDASAARSLTIGEKLPALRELNGVCSCHCGRMFASKAALDGHRASFHLELSTVQWFADPSNVCLSCLVCFSNRSGLCSHLTYGTGVCLLNTLIRMPPLSDDVIRAALKHERISAVARERAGLGTNLVDTPAHRLKGPLWQHIDFDGTFISVKSNRHPFGPQKRKYRVPDSDESAVED